MSDKRLFVAIDMPKEVNRELGTYARVLRDVRWYEPDDFHLTLKFIGEVKEEKQPEIEEALANIKQDSFTMTINRLGYFPPGKHPRVIWAGFEENSSLQHLNSAIEDLLEPLGVERENRSYIPHVTIGKNKGVPKTRVEQYVSNHNDIYIPDIPVTEFLLYSSKLTPEGAIHTPERRYPLT